MDKAASQLANRLAKYSRGITLNKGLLRDIEDVVKDHRRQCWNNYGIKFPKMVAVVLPTVGQIMLHNEECDEKSIQAIVVNIVMQYPAIPMSEVAQAIAYAFPHYKPGRINFAPGNLTKQ